MNGLTPERFSNTISLHPLLNINDCLHGHGPHSSGIFFQDISVLFDGRIISLHVTYIISLVICRVVSMLPFKKHFWFIKDRCQIFDNLNVSKLHMAPGFCSSNRGHKVKKKFEIFNSPWYFSLIYFSINPTVGSTVNVLDVGIYFSCNAIFHFHLQIILQQFKRKVQLKCKTRSSLRRMIKRATWTSVE